MTQITLQAYLKEIDQLIDDNRLTEAVAHCKHILRQHPRYIEAYRLLGKALLEQHEYVSATDIFQRILSADPEDFVAHVGLSVAYKAEELINDAIWHMERAYEIQPYNTTIQHELRDLYAWRDGELKTRALHIPPIALARLHFNTGLYQQAINTLRATLNEQPDRVDARALLAEALWRDDQRIDAVDVCLQLLETLPYCIKANAILSEIWLMTGRIDEAQSYLQKLQSLTLPTRATLITDTPVTSAFNTDGAIAIPQQLTVEKLDKVIEEEMVLTGVPNWVDDLDLSGDIFLESSPTGDTGGSPLTSLPNTEYTPDWLRSLTDSAPAEQSGRESADVLDWLREVASSEDEETLTIVADLPPSPSLIDTKPLPDWLSEVLDDDSLIPPVESQQVTTPSATPTSNSADDEKWIYDDATDAPPGVPDWMQASEGDEELHPAPTHETLNRDEFPDWLEPQTAADSLQRPPSTISDDWFTATPTDDQELSGWLDSLASPEDQPAASSQSADLPDWFGDLTNEVSPSGPENTPTNLPDWLADLSTSPETPPQAQPSSKEAMPDWLSDLTGPFAAATPTATPEPTSPPAADTQLPDWLNDLSSEPEPETGSPLSDFFVAAPVMTETDDLADSDTNDIPDWITDFASQEEADAMPADQSDRVRDGEPEESPVSEPDRPDWLSQLASADESESDAALPDWLSAMPQDAAAEEPLVTTDDNATAIPDWMSQLPPADESESDAALPDWLSAMPQDAAADESPAATDETTTSISDWMSQLSTDDEPESDAILPDWLSAMPQDAAADESPAATDETTTDVPDWMSQLPPEDESESDAVLPDWLSAMPQDAAAEEPPAVTDETMTDVPDWMSQLPPEDEPESDAVLPDWLSAMPQDAAADEPSAASDETTTDVPDWLTTLDFTADTNLTDTIAPAFLLEQFDLETPDTADQARETTNMADVPPKTPRRAKADESNNELDWLDELAGLPLDEPSTIPGSQNDLEIPVDNLLDDDQADLDPADADWLDALNPTDGQADLTLDWLDDLEQPEVEESPTLSWLSEDDLRGQNTNAFVNAEEEDGADLEEAMAWLESIVTDQESPQSAYDPDHQTNNELDWLDNLAEEPAADLTQNIVLTEESPTTVETIPVAAEDDDALLGDLFNLDDQPESAGELAAAISWLDELQSAGQQSALPGDFVHAGPPPDDPEAAMAWLEQLAAAQAAEESAAEEAEWPAPFAEHPPTAATAMSDVDWLDALAEPTTEGETASLFDLEQPLAESTDWLDEVTSSASDEPAESLPNWLDELAETPTDESLPGSALALDALESAGTLDWLDEMPEVGTDEPLPGPSLTVEEAEPTFDWLDDLAAASPEEAFPLDEPVGESLPNWIDELPAAPEAPEPSDATVLPTPSTPPAMAESTYVPPTNISPEAAKILDMSDLFEMDDVEESEEDMAQAMAWMNELIGDLGTPAAAPTEPVAVEPEPVAELPWLDELVAPPADEIDTTTAISAPPEPEPTPEPATFATMLADQPTYVPPTNISPEAAKILDMSDLFAMDDVEESEEDMAQAMAWMQELMGDMGTPSTPTPVATTPEPVAEPPVAEEVGESADWLDELLEAPATSVSASAPEEDEAMAWLDEIVADIGHEPVAATTPVTDTSDEALDWLNEIVADLGLESEPTPAVAAITPVEEPPTPQTALFVPELEPEPVAAQPIPATPPTEPTYVPPTNISAEAAKILDMSDLFEMDAVEESEEDMAQAMAWMQELMGDFSPTTSTAPDTPPTPVAAIPEPEAEPEIPATVIAATPVVDEEDSALNWLNELADLDMPISELPSLEAIPPQPFDLDKPFTINDLDRSTPTEDDTASALNWLDQMVAAQESQPEVAAPVTASNEDIFADLSNIPEDPDAAMDWLENLSAAQEATSEELPASTPVVIDEPPTPAVPTAVMDALAKVETRRERAKTGPLRPQTVLPPSTAEADDWATKTEARRERARTGPLGPSRPQDAPPPAETDMDALVTRAETRRERGRTGPLRPQDVPPLPTEEDAPLSLISELTAGDVSESLPEWLSLDKINTETSTLSWLSSRDMDATGWLESEAAMVDAEPEMNLPPITPTEPVRDEMPRREPEPATFPQVSEAFEFKVDLNMGSDDGQFVTARQQLQARHYDEAVRVYSTLLESTPSVTPIITELEGAVDSHPSQPLLRRLLGDAYMRNGQLQKALETYRKALDQL